MTRSTPGPKYLTPHIFVKRLRELGIVRKVETVRRWCRRGEVRSRKVGQHHYIPESELGRFEESSDLSDFE